MRPFVALICMVCLVAGVMNWGTCGPQKPATPKGKSWEMELVKPDPKGLIWEAKSKEPVADFANGKFETPLALDLSNVKIKGAKNVSVRVYANSNKPGASRELVSELFFFPSTGNVESGFVVDIARALKKLDADGALDKNKPLVVSIEPSPSHPGRDFQLKDMTVEKATLSRSAKK